MMFEIEDLGLGSCWVGYFNRDEIKHVLKLGENDIVTALLPLGYKKEGTKANPRHEIRNNIDDIVEII